jgi:sulfate adenylyltransferase subunit 2
LLYSIGKDSSVLLHLALKAFRPGKPPLPLLHIDTTWKFRDMIAFRDSRAEKLGLKLIVHVNRDGIQRGIGPISHPELHTDVMKTQALRQALEGHGFDVALGGTRRDEERSRAKERVFSLRSAQHRWDPKRQRAEPWRLYNTRKRKRRRLSGISAVKLDRARRLALHPFATHPGGSSLFCSAPAGRSPLRYIDHGR